MGADSKIEWTDHTFNPWWGNGPDSWHANPWVWVVGFRRVEASR